MSDATRDEKVWATIEKLYEESGFRLFEPATIEMHTDGISETEAFLSLTALSAAGKLRHEVEIGCEDEGHTLWSGPVSDAPSDDSFHECVTCDVSFDDDTELVRHPVFILDRPGRPTKEQRLEAEVARLSAALRASTASESRLRGALEDFIAAVERLPRARLHQVHAPPIFVCVCEAESDSDYPTDKPCTCPRPEYKRGCVPECVACATDRDRFAALSAARAALLPEGTPGDGK